MLWDVWVKAFLTKYIVYWTITENNIIEHYKELYIEHHRAIYRTSYRECTYIANSTTTHFNKDVYYVNGASGNYYKKRIRELISQSFLKR